MRNLVTGSAAYTFRCKNYEGRCVAKRVEGKKYEVTSNIHLQPFTSAKPIHRNSKFLIRS